jgi:hypothetical protein
LAEAAERLDGLRTPEGEPIPPNTLAELRRDMVRRRLVSDQIRQIEDARLERLEHAPGGCRDCHHLAVITLAPQPPEEGAFEQLGVEPVGLGAPPPHYSQEAHPVLERSIIATVSKFLSSFTLSTYSEVGCFRRLTNRTHRHDS